MHTLLLYGNVIVHIHSSWACTTSLLLCSIRPLREIFFTALRNQCSRYKWFIHKGFSTFKIIDCETQTHLSMVHPGSCHGFFGRLLLRNFFFWRRILELVCICLLAVGRGLESSLHKAQLSGHGWKWWWSYSNLRIWHPWSKSWGSAPASSSCVLYSPSQSWDASDQAFLLRPLRLFVQWKWAETRAMLFKCASQVSQLEFVDG